MASDTLTYPKGDSPMLLQAKALINKFALPLAIGIGIAINNGANRIGAAIKTGEGLVSACIWTGVGVATAGLSDVYRAVAVAPNATLQHVAMSNVSINALDTKLNAIAVKLGVDVPAPVPSADHLHTTQSDAINAKPVDTIRPNA